MSSDSAKRRAKGNAALLKKTAGVVALVTLISLALHRILNTPFLSAPTLVCSGLELLIYCLLYRMSRLSVVKGKGRVEINVEVDLNARGAIRILIDTIYVSLLGKVLSAALSKKALLVFLLVPVSVYYEVFLRGRKKLLQRSGKLK